MGESQRRISTADGVDSARYSCSEIGCFLYETFPACAVSEGVDVRDWILKSAMEIGLRQIHILAVELLIDKITLRIRVV